MAAPTAHTWTCPSCGRRVPLRAAACHCGMTRARAEELGTAQVAVAPAAAAARPPRSRFLVSGRDVVAVMPRDVKALVVAGAMVMAAGLGWLVFAPSRASSIPPLLGHVDAGPPPPPKPTPPPRPPFKLPWWK